LFPPIFNIADSAISVGIVLLLLFQKRFFAEEDLKSAKEEGKPNDAEVHLEATSEVSE
jgi:hypothetical protein